jgi:hypothetical protein
MGSIRTCVIIFTTKITQKINDSRKGRDVQIREHEKLISFSISSGTTWFEVIK